MSYTYTQYYFCFSTYNLYGHIFNQQYKNSLLMYYCYYHLNKKYNIPSKVNSLQDRTICFLKQVNIQKSKKKNSMSIHEGNRIKSFVTIQYLLKFYFITNN